MSYEEGQSEFVEYVRSSIVSSEPDRPMYWIIWDVEASQYVASATENGVGVRTVLYDTLMHAILVLRRYTDKVYYFHQNCTTTILNPREIIKGFFSMTSFDDIPSRHPHILRWSIEEENVVVTHGLSAEPQEG